MEVFVNWEQDTVLSSAYAAKVNLRQLLDTPLEAKSVSTRSCAEDGRCLSCFHVESFCTPNHHITATYNSGPLTSLFILVTTPAVLRSSKTILPRASKLSFKPVLGKHSPQQRRECLFSSIGSFSSLASATFTSEEQVTDAFFRIQLDDGSYLTHFDESEYCVGGGERRIPYSLEIPLPWPLERQVRKGQVVSLYRSNLFWLQPQLHCNDLSQLFHETNFVLAGLERKGDNKSREDDDFVCLMVTRDQTHALRSTLFSTGTYVAIRIETTCVEVPSSHSLADLVVCHMATGADPFTTVGQCVESHSLRVRTFSSRSRKLSSPKWQTLSTEAKVLTRMGYCTWDGVGHKCSQASVTAALKWLEDKQIPISYVVIDDGWQEGGSSGPLSEADRSDRPSPKLTSFHANEKFPGSMRPLSREGRTAVFVWMTVIGYWGGADGTCFEGDTIHVAAQASIGLQRNQPNHTKMWEREYEIMNPTARNLDRFFTDYFKALSADGVTCVKIDGQSILGSFKTNKHLSPLVGEYRDSIRRAAEKVFPGEVVLNSMACSQEMLLHSGGELSESNACWRTSDDHTFPGVKETDEMVAWHVLRNAMNGLFLGEIFPVTDWDMFRLCDRNAYTHAVARVVSGGPLYISDTVPFDEEFAAGAHDLVRRLTGSDGRIVRCVDPGRATADCVFGDPRQRRMFKVFNRNDVSGVVGLFNLSTRESGHEVRGEYSPGDVEDFRRGARVGFVSVVVGSSWRCAFRHDGCDAKRAITLPPMGAAIAHIYPVVRFCGGVEVAVVGRLDLLNCGGVVKCVAAGKDGDDGVTVEVTLVDCGTVAVWLGDEAVSRLVCLTACGEQQDITFVAIDDLRFLSVTVPTTDAQSERLVRLGFTNSGRGFAKKVEN